MCDLDLQSVTKQEGTWLRCRIATASEDTMDTGLVMQSELDFRIPPRILTSVKYIHTIYILYKQYDLSLKSPPAY